MKGDTAKARLSARKLSLELEALAKRYDDAKPMRLGPAIDPGLAAWRKERGVG
ncbi:hypothetical protein LCGC14_0587750 [marine sediment metagenome]|uniref:Uncharacterized protein n=1 Tax=marine sediment metagenome TaxID=412755 RepID=A0A0F9RY90_9ZZZZ